MGRLNKAIDQIRAQMARLGPSQRLLIGSLVVIMLMTLFVVQQYTGKPAMVQLISGASATEMDDIQSYLTEMGEPFTLKGGAIMVPVAKKRPLLSLLSQQERLPADNKLTLESMVANRTWWETAKQSSQAETVAIQNELGAIIAGWKGIRSARVIIDVPSSQPIGDPSRAPTAAVSVVSERGIDQQTADAIIRFVTSTRAGLTADRVRVVDATISRQFRVTDESDYGASNYQEAVASIEKRKQSSLLSALAYIPNVIVTVHAQVEQKREQRTVNSVLPEGGGSVVALSSETVSTTTSSAGVPGAEPSVRANTSADLTKSDSGGGESSSQRTTTTEFSPEFGRETKVINNPGGYPTKINAVVSVPRHYFEHIWTKQQGTPAEGEEAPAPPADTDPAFTAIVAAEVERISQEVRLLIQTDNESGTVGEVAVSMIPTMPDMLAAGMASTSGPLGMTAGTLTSAEFIKTVGLGGLAVVSLALVALTAMRSSKREELPSADQLVGLPKALEGDADLIGEADEADSVLAGLELSDEELTQRKMQEQVQEMVSKSPEQAAMVLSRWVRT